MVRFACFNINRHNFRFEVFGKDGEFDGATPRIGRCYDSTIIIHCHSQENFSVYIGIRANCLCNYYSLENKT